MNASDCAYKRARTPDAFAMMITYGLTAALAAADGEDRAQTTPWLPILLLLKVASDVATNLTLAREQWAENKALCACCQSATVLSLAWLALAWPEAREAWKNKQNKQQGPDSKTRRPMFSGGASCCERSPCGTPELAIGGSPSLCATAADAAGPQVLEGRGALHPLLERLARLCRGEAAPLPRGHAHSHAGAIVGAATQDAGHGAGSRGRLKDLGSTRKDLRKL